MATHYIAAFAPVLGTHVMAICQRYVDYSQDSYQPSCEDCRRLIAEEDAARAKQPVSIAEVVERY